MNKDAKTNRETLSGAITQSGVEARFMQMNETVEGLLSALDNKNNEDAPRILSVDTPNGNGLDLITQDQMRFALENISYELADILRKVRR